MIKVAFIVPDNRDEFQTYDVPEPIFGPAPSTLLKGFALLDDCEIHVLAGTKKPVRAPTKLAGNIYFHSIHTRYFGRFRALYGGTILAIRRRLRSIGPDIVHGQGAERYPALAAALSGFPNVVTLHGVVSQLAVAQKASKLSFLGITARLEKIALKRTNGVICLSSHSERVVRGVNPRTWRTANAADESFFSVNRAPAQPPEIVYAAHVYRLKNHVNLIKSLDPLAAKIPLILRCLGKLTGDPTCLEAQRLAESRPWCRLDGFVEPSGLREALSRAAALVHPSLEENCPMSILEAMAAGLPVAGSRVGGIPDLVDEGVTGLLFDPQKLESIRGAVERILTEPSLARKMGEAARQRAEREFRPAAIARRHLEIYREVLRR